MLDHGQRRGQHVRMRSREDRLQRQHHAVIVVILARHEPGIAMAVRELMLRRFVRVVREAAVVMGRAMAVNDQRWMAVPDRFGVHVLDRRQRQRRQAHGEEQGNQRAGQHHA